MATTLSMTAFTAGVNNAVTPTVSVSQDQNVLGQPEEPASVQTDSTQLEVEGEEAAKIDAYFKQYNMPLAGYGMEMVTQADKYGIDPFLMPAIAVRESTGGLHQCKSVSYSPFGFGSCKISFSSYNDAIDTLAENLGGANPATADAYKGKSTKQILYSYNSVKPGYYDSIIGIENAITATQVQVATAPVTQA